MKTIKVLQYDVFSKEPNKGNPAAVVLNGEGLTEKEMQEAAYKIGFNETSFLLKSDIADYKIRYFTPGHEMNLCGHGTLAVIYGLKSQLKMEKNDITIETKAGILPIHTDTFGNDDFQIVMKQASPEFKNFEGSYEKLADAIGINREDMDDKIPAVYGSTGIWTLLVPIKNLSIFKKMNPINELFPNILTEIPGASIHPFCFETYNKDAHLHARHFSSPYSGTKEDPVTGTASGVLGAYYAKFIKNDSESIINLTVEQGQEMGKDGKVKVRVSKNKDTFEVAIIGNAVFVKDFNLNI